MLEIKIIHESNCGVEKVSLTAKTDAGGITEAQDEEIPLKLEPPSRSKTWRHILVSAFFGIIHWICKNRE